MGMKVLEARDQVLELITRDIQSLGIQIEIDSNSPDGDLGKFTIEKRPARVIHPWDGFYANINKTWFNGSYEEPKIKGGAFYWYVFALEGKKTGIVDYYYICDYKQMRAFVLDFDAPAGNTHRDHISWRGEIHILKDNRGYFRWGDEDPQLNNRKSRYIKLGNIVDVVDPAIHLPAITNETNDGQAINDLREKRQSYLHLATTEKEAVVQSRLGQGLFRKMLIDLWGRCAITNCSNLRLLRASHIKPWRLSSNEERLDPFNGVLLVAHLDLAFDIGLISFDTEGNILISSQVDSDTRTILGLDSFRKLRNIEEEHRPYLHFHHENIFRS